MLDYARYLGNSSHAGWQAIPEFATQTAKNIASLAPYQSELLSELFLTSQMYYYKSKSEACYVLHYKINVS